MRLWCMDQCKRQQKQGEPTLPDLRFKLHSQHGEVRKKGGETCREDEYGEGGAGLHAERAAR